MKISVYYDAIHRKWAVVVEYAVRFWSRSIFRGSANMESILERNGSLEISSWWSQMVVCYLVVS